jgi:sulfopyruvate decarboxylase TPP-binding subunit
MESNIKNTFGSAAKDAGIDFVFGVPDSLLKHPIAQLRTVFSKDGFFIAANEGSAIGLAIGHHLSGGHLPLVFVTGPGAEARNSIGIVLVAGMAIGTLFTLFVVPSLYVLIAGSKGESHANA